MAITGVNHVWFHLFILMTTFKIYQTKDPDCVYTVHGLHKNRVDMERWADSIIRLTVYDATGYGIRVSNLEAWGGLMGPGYDYFERENLFIFSGTRPCLTGPVCAMNLTSDGSGPHHGSGTQLKFKVEQLLAADTSPYELTAIRSNCDKQVVIGDDSNSSALVVET